MLWNTKEYKNKVAFNHTMVTSSWQGAGHTFGGKNILSQDSILFLSDISKWPEHMGVSVICEFTINSNFSLQPDANSSALQFDLNVNQTFLIMAQGELTNCTDGENNCTMK